MGIVRTACVALALVVAGGMSTGVEARVGRSRGVQVSCVARLPDVVGVDANQLLQSVRFDSDGNAVAVGNNGRSYRRVTPEGEVSTFVPVLFGRQGDFLGFLPQQDVQQPADPGGPVERERFRDGLWYVLTRRATPESALWLQRFRPDGTSDAPAVRVTPAGAQPVSDSGWTLDFDAAGSVYVVWRSGTDDSLNWNRVDPDGTVSPTVRVFGVPQGALIRDWTRRTGPDGTTWVQPDTSDPFSQTEPFGLIGVRRDGGVLPVIDLYAVPRKDGNGTPTSGFATFGIDAAGEVRTLRLGAIFPGWRPTWRRFRADGTEIRRRRLVEPRASRRAVGRSFVLGTDMAVAPDGTSLVVVARRSVPSETESEGLSVIEYLHLDSDGRVLSKGSFTPHRADMPRLAVGEFDGRPRFALAWNGRATADGPTQAFVAILE